MIESAEAGAIMRLLLFIPFKTSNPSHLVVTGWWGIIRLVALFLSVFFTQRYLIYYRGSHKSRLWPLALLVGLVTLLYTAAIAEVEQQDLDLKAYHDLLGRNFLFIYGISLLARQVYKLCVSVPGPFIAKSTFCWRVWHLVHGTSDQAILQAHRKYGTVVRLSPYEYSIAKNDRKSVSQKLQLVNNSGAYIDLIHICKEFFQSSFMQSQLMEQALAQEHAIDRTIDDLIDKLAEWTDNENGIQLSRTITCFCWDVMGATTIGDRFGLLRSANAAAVFDKIVSFKTEALINGSFFRFYPWITKIRSVFASRQDTMTECIKLFEKTLVECHMSQNEGSSDANKSPEQGLRERIEEKSKLINRSLTVKQPECYLSSVLCLLIGAADPIATHIQTTMAYLACYPEAQDQIRQELKSLGEKESLTFSKLLELHSSFPYLDSVLRESDRLKGAEKIVLNHYSERPVIVDKYRIPVGSTIHISSVAAGRDQAKYGSDADDWNPERWLKKEDVPSGIAFGSSTFPYNNTTARAVVAKIVLRLIDRFSFATKMHQPTSSLVAFTLKDLLELQVLLKDSPSLANKVANLLGTKSIAPGPHSKAYKPGSQRIVTCDSGSFEKLINEFDGEAQTALTQYLTSAEPSRVLTAIESKPIDRDQRCEIHSLIRQLSKGSLDSVTSHDTGRIKVFMRGSQPQFHRQPEKRPFANNRYQGNKQKFNPTKPSVTRNTTASRGAGRRTSPSAEGTTAAPAVRRPINSAWNNWIDEEQVRLKALRDSTLPPSEVESLARLGVEHEFKKSGDKGKKVVDMRE